MSHDRGVCEECGADVAAGAGWCGACGARVARPELLVQHLPEEDSNGTSNEVAEVAGAVSGSQGEERHQQRSRWWRAGVVAVVVGMVAAALAVSRPDPEVVLSASARVHPDGELVLGAARWESDLPGLDVTSSPEEVLPLGRVGMVVARAPEPAPDARGNPVEPPDHARVVGYGAGFDNLWATPEHLFVPGDGWTALEPGEYVLSASPVMAWLHSDTHRLVHLDLTWGTRTPIRVPGVDAFPVATNAPAQTAVVAEPFGRHWRIGPDLEPEPLLDGSAQIDAVSILGDSQVAVLGQRLFEAGERGPEPTIGPVLRVGDVELAGHRNVFDALRRDPFDLVVSHDLDGVSYVAATGSTADTRQLWFWPTADADPVDVLAGPEGAYVRTLGPPGGASGLPRTHDIVFGTTVIQLRIEDAAIRSVRTMAEPGEVVPPAIIGGTHPLVASPGTRGAEALGWHRIDRDTGAVVQRIPHGFDISRAWRHHSGIVGMGSGRIVEVTEGVLLTPVPTGIIEILAVGTEVIAVFNDEHDELHILRRNDPEPVPIPEVHDRTAFHALVTDDLLLVATSRDATSTETVVVDIATLEVLAELPDAISVEAMTDGSVVMLSLGANDLTLVSTSDLTRGRVTGPSLRTDDRPRLFLGDRVLTSNDDRELSLWQFGRDEPIWTVETEALTATPVIIGTEIVTASDRGLVTYDLATGTELRNQPIERGLVRSLELAGDVLLVGGNGWLEGYAISDPGANTPDP